MFSQKISDFQFPDYKEDSFLKNYDNQRDVVEMHVDILFNLPYISKSSSELHKFLNIILSSLSALEILGYMRDKLSDLFLVKSIIKKLDFETQSLIENFKNSYGLPTCNELIKFLFKRIHVLKTFELSKHILEANSRQSSKSQETFNDYTSNCCPDLINSTSKSTFETNFQFITVPKKSEPNTKTCQTDRFFANNDKHGIKNDKRIENYKLKINQKQFSVNIESHNTKDIPSSTAIVLVNDHKGLSHCRTLLDSTDSFFFNNYPNFL